MPLPNTHADFNVDHRFMHPALEIPEILLDIFHHCCPPDLSEVDRKEAIPDLAALARSCRTFKEPALDVLWGVLIDLSPLVRCLPEASSRKTSLKKMVRFFQGFFTFSLAFIFLLSFCGRAVFI